MQYAHTAADALMVSLLGLTIKITGANDHGVDYQVQLHKLLQ